MRTRSKLFLNAFTTIVVGVLLFAGAIYVFSVPWIGRTVADLEERSGRVVLDSVYELVQNSHRDIVAWRESTLAARRRELRNIVAVVKGYIEQENAEVADGRVGIEAVQRKILEDVRHFTYGQNDYVWIADYASRLISHPDPKLHGADFSRQADIYGNLIVPPMVAGARQDGAGFHSYWWRRLGEEEPVEKLTYYEHLPEWQWVIGTGVYVDDVEREVAARKAAVTERLRRHLHTTRIANTGYLYVFDSGMNMIIHPNENIEGTHFADLRNPVSGNPIGEDLIAAAASPGGSLLYRWDKPSDPGNYVYEKISWVRYLPELDWYIASSVYLDEFRQTSDVLTTRILVIAVLALALGVAGGYLFLRRLIVPISRLADSASKVGEGDLSAKTDIRRDDEIGILANAFNAMVDRLKDHIENLESRVAERTAELVKSVRVLERRNRESAEINRMGDQLQYCRSEREVFAVAAKTCHALFPEDAGGIYLLDGHGRLERVSRWGDGAGTPGCDGDAPVPERGGVLEAPVDGQACWAVRRGKSHREIRDGTGALCPYSRGDAPCSLCVPLLSGGSVQGVFKLVVGETDAAPDALLDARQGLLETIADNVALSVANLQLRERLRQQSLRDPLTGLYNRRYLEQAFEQERSRAARNGGSFALVMLDVDHFKRFNDTYGHETGDAVLRAVGGLLLERLRRHDIACRFGGEEFTLVLPETGERDAAEIAELVRSRVENEVATALAQPIEGRVTVSLGVAVFPAHGSDFRSLIKVADAALYRAKEAGRNRIAFAAG